MRQPDSPPFVWSTLTVKSLDEAERSLTGVASTISTDRVGDIVEPMGAAYTLPIPFLWQHDAEQPVGHVVAAAPNASGIPVKIQLAQTDEVGILRDRLDEAWQSIKLGLVRGLSIGFRPVESSYIEATGGYRFSKWDWLELSAVTIPANSEASIATIKRYDHASARPSQKGVPLSFLKQPWPFKNQTWRKTTPSRFASQIGSHLLASVGDVVSEALSARDSKIKTLELELAARTYKGVFDPAIKYVEHNMCTKGGNLWIAIADSPGEPGRSPGWKMAVKRGRDGRA
jgi:HK97 family phage prohead protease